MQHRFPQFYKVLIMSAFPPLDALDGKGIDFETINMEKMMLGFLKLCDSSLERSQSFLKANESTRGKVSNFGRIFMFRK